MQNYFFNLAVFLVRAGLAAMALCAEANAISHVSIVGFPMGTMGALVPSLFRQYICNLKVTLKFF